MLNEDETWITTCLSGIRDDEIFKTDVIPAQARNSGCLFSQA